MAVFNRNETYVRGEKTGTEANPVFNDLGNKPRVITPEQVKQCAPAKHLTTGVGTKTYYAIARINGIIDRGPSPLQKDDGACMLYISTDLYAVEVHLNVIGGDWSEVPRKFHSNTTKARKGNEWMEKAFNKGIEAHAAYLMD